MKVTKTNQTSNFNPFKIEIVIESQQEKEILTCLFARDMSIPKFLQNGFLNGVEASELTKMMRNLHAALHSET